MSPIRSHRDGARPRNCGQPLTPVQYQWCCHQQPLVCLRPSVLEPHFSLNPNCSGLPVGYYVSCWWPILSAEMSISLRAT